MIAMAALFIGGLCAYVYYKLSKDEKDDVPTTDV